MGCTHRKFRVGARPTPIPTVNNHRAGNHKTKICIRADERDDRQRVATASPSNPPAEVLGSASSFPSSSKARHPVSLPPGASTQDHMRLQLPASLGLSYSCSSFLSSVKKGSGLMRSSCSGSRHMGQGSSFLPAAASLLSLQQWMHRS